METNNNTKTIVLWVIGILVIAAIIYGFVGSFSTKDAGQVKDTTPTHSLNEKAITVRHQYKNAKHTFIGEIDLPTPCHKLASTYSTAKTKPPTYTIELKTSTSGDFCAQVVSTKAFKITFPGDKVAQFEATLDGKKLILNILEVGDNEDLESFDPYTKG